MKVIKNIPDENILVLTDVELRDIKDAVYMAMKSNDELSKKSDTDHHGSPHRTANRLEVLYNQL